LRRLDEGSDAKAFGFPIYVSEDEIGPDATLFENGTYRFDVVLLADAVEDAAFCKCDDDVVDKVLVFDAAFGDGAFPKGLVEIPDD